MLILHLRNVLYICGAILIDQSTAVCQNAEACLYDELFADYNRFARPLEDTTEAITVSVGLNLKSLSDMDDKGEIMHIVGYVSAAWTDAFLQWDLNDYNNTIWMNLPANKIWLPDLIFENSVASFYEKTHKEDFLVAIHYTGLVLWEYGGIISTKCDFDISNFPFDKQTCDVEIGVWTYVIAELDLKVLNLKHDSYKADSLWKLDKTTSKSQTRSGAYARAVFSLTWSRKSGYYVFNIILPTVLVMIVALGVFWVPADCGEKVSLGITVLLAFSVLQIIITEATPVNSDVTPQINQLVVTFMAMSTISLIGAMLSIYLNYKSTETRVPRIIRTIAFKGFARLLFLTRDVPQDQNQIFPTPDEEQRHAENAPIPPMAATRAEKNAQNGDLNDILTELRKITDKLEEQNKTDFILTEWKVLAKIVDRILFWLSLVVILITMLAIYA